MISFQSIAKNFKIFVACSLLIPVSSCEKEETIIVSKNNIEAIVTKEYVNSIVEKLSPSNFKTGIEKTNLKNSHALKEVTEVSLVKENNVPYFYVINYLSTGGFIILSADRNIAPILAYSETGFFDINSEEVTDTGLSDWLKSTKNYIADCKNKKIVASKIIAEQWQNLTTFDIKQNKPNDLLQVLSIRDEPCYSWYELSPLLTTKWGQDCGYNDYTPYCSNGYCGRMKTGCVATAMAQILKYYNYPNTFSYTYTYNWNYSLMPNSVNTYGASPATAQLMKDLGDIVSMNYGCTLSGANIQLMVSAFISMGYQTNFAPYNKASTISAIENGKPVCLTGINSSNSQVHIWIADGYKKLFLCSGTSNLDYLHMNWGYGGNSDGWYSNFSSYDALNLMIIPSRN
jgi:hypothetical protein